MIKFCIDIDCNSNDGGIAPKNICQSCLDKLHVVFEFKMKSHESDKYLKQIISHSVTPPIATQVHDEASPFDSYNNDEDSLLEPLEEYQHPSTSNRDTLDLAKGQRHGEFECHICRKSFKYVKPYKNHMKLHKKNKTKPVFRTGLTYYKRKKLEAAAAAGISSQHITIKKAPVLTPADYELEKLQADYDSVSSYKNSAAASYANEQKSKNSRDSSPDFGALMLSTSQYIGIEVSEQVNNVMPRRTGRPLKRAIVDDDSPSINQNIVKKLPNILTKKPAISVKKKPEVEVQTRKPGPLSRTRGKVSISNKHDSSDEVMIADFCEVDINKMLKKPRTVLLGEQFVLI